MYLPIELIELICLYLPITKMTSLMHPTENYWKQYIEFNYPYDICDGYSYTQIGINLLMGKRRVIIMDDSEIKIMYLTKEEQLEIAPNFNRMYFQDLLCTGIQYSSMNISDITGAIKHLDLRVAPTIWRRIKLLLIKLLITTFIGKWWIRHIIKKCNQISIPTSNIIICFTHNLIPHLNGLNLAKLIFKMYFNPKSESLTDLTMTLIDIRYRFIRAALKNTFSKHIFYENGTEYIFRKDTKLNLLY